MSYVPPNSAAMQANCAELKEKLEAIESALNQIKEAMSSNDMTSTLETIMCKMSDVLNKINIMENVAEATKNKIVELETILEAVPEAVLGKISDLEAMIKNLYITDVEAVSEVILNKLAELQGYAEATIDALAVISRDMWLQSFVGGALGSGYMLFKIYKYIKKSILAKERRGYAETLREIAHNLREEQEQQQQQQEQVQSGGRRGRQGYSSAVGAMRRVRSDSVLSDLLTGYYDLNTGEISVCTTSPPSTLSTELVDRAMSCDIYP